MRMEHYELYRKITEQIRMLKNFTEELEENDIESDDLLVSHLEQTVQRLRELRSIKSASGIACAYMSN